MHQTLNYKVLIRKDKRTGTEEACYTAYVPELGVATDGDNIQETIKNANDLIKFQLECLATEGQEIPSSDETESLVYDSRVEVLSNNSFRLAC